MTTVYGSKYESTKDLSRVEIAKLIRLDIKAAVKDGSLPKAKYSVTTQSYSGGGSISVTISDVDVPGFRMANPARLAWNQQSPHRALCDAPKEAYALRSPEAEELLKKVKAITDSYNFDGSDIQTDYFHVRFYDHIEFDYAWLDELQTRELAELNEVKAASSQEK